MSKIPLKDVCVRSLWGCARACVWVCVYVAVWVNRNNEVTELSLKRHGYRGCLIRAELFPMSVPSLSLWYPCSLCPARDTSVSSLGPSYLLPPHSIWAEDCEALFSLCFLSKWLANWPLTCGQLFAYIYIFNFFEGVCKPSSPKSKMQLITACPLLQACILYIYLSTL